MVRWLKQSQSGGKWIPHTIKDGCSAKKNTLIIYHLIQFVYQIIASARMYAFLS